ATSHTHNLSLHDALPISRRPRGEAPSKSVTKRNWRPFQAKRYGQEPVGFSISSRATTAHWLTLISSLLTNPSNQRTATESTCARSEEHTSELQSLTNLVS